MVYRLGEVSERLTFDNANPPNEVFSIWIILPKTDDILKPKGYGEGIGGSAVTHIERRVHDIQRDPSMRQGVCASGRCRSGDQSCRGREKQRVVGNKRANVCGTTGCDHLIGYFVTNAHGSHWRIRVSYLETDFIPRCRALEGYCFGQGPR